MCKWIPVKHSDICGKDVIVSELPKDGEAVFVTVEGTKVLFGTFLPLPDRRKDFIHFGEKVEAWMKLPEPYKPTPDKCFKCNHGHLQHDESSDNWFECELLQRDVPPNDKPEDCPLDR